MKKWVGRSWVQIPCRQRILSHEDFLFQWTCAIAIILLRIFYSIEGHGHILRNDDPSNDISRLLEDDCSNTLLELEPTCRLLESHEYFEDNGHEYFFNSIILQGTCIREICHTMQNVFEVYSWNAIWWIVISKDMSFSILTGANIILFRVYVRLMFPKW